MFSSLAILSALTTAAFAQSSSSVAPATPSANPLIPTGISSQCTSFLQSLNTDSEIANCLSAVSTATSAFQPGTNSTPSAASVSSALTSLCSDSVTTACSETTIRTKITDFYTSCTPELTSKIPDVIRTYDVLYTLLPLRESVCSKDDGGSWCVMASPTSTREVAGDVAPGESSTLGLAQLLALLYTNNGAALKRRAPTTAIVPNMTTYHDTNLPFLFFTPDLDATNLCTSCARSVLAAYIDFESNVPYAPGLASSQLLDTQSALYKAIQDKCPAGFLSGAVQAAGGLSGGILPSGAVPAASAEHKALIALALGVASIASAFAL